MSPWLECGAVSIGEAAWASCLRQSPARVIGVTSRGVFLLAPPQRISFVSFERYRSPLTINLDHSGEQLRTIEVGEAAQLSATRLSFPSIEFAISLSESNVWQCPPPHAVSRSHTEQRQILQAIVDGVLALRSNDGLAALLPTLLGWPAASPLSPELAALLDRLIALRQTLQIGDNSALLAGLTGLLGQGRGLTPSGDDVAIGLLLMLNRWRSQRVWGEVHRAVIDLAYRATTTISANLIECAADGQGDERLITVVDGIAAGSAATNECVECVLGWGSSSGIDALVGMAVAL